MTPWQYQKCAINDDNTMKFVTETRFDSMDEWNDYPHGWEVDFCATCPGDARSTMQQSAAPRLLITKGTFEAPTLQRGTTPNGMRTFALPLSPGRDIMWRGHRAMRGALLVFPDDRELHCTTAGPVSILTLSVADTLIAQCCDGPELDNSQFRNGGALSLLDTELNRLLHHVSVLGEFVAKYGNHRHAPSISRLLEEELLQNLCGQLLVLTTEAGRINPDKRYRVIRAALDFIDSRIRSPIRVSEVSRAVGVSTRTLQLCFRQHFGATPKQVIRTQQLRGIRRALQQADPSHDLVKDIAYAWGVWHLGQFSRDYRRLFGETPITTLQQHQPTRAS